MSSSSRSHSPLSSPAPQGFEPEAKELVKGLLRPNANNRLGAGKAGAAQIQGHDWFAKHKFDWAKLLATTLPAPFVPSIKDPLDVSNFDPYDEDDSVPRFTGNQETYKDWSDEFVTFPPRQGA